MNGRTRRVLLRADASSQMGMGHAQRCLVLAAALQRRGVQTRLLTRDLGFDLAPRAQAMGIELQQLPASTAQASGDRVPHAAWAGVAWSRDAQECIAAARGWAPDWVVVDHYSFDARWHEQVAASLGCRMAVIDDLADRAVWADLLLDQNPHPDHRLKYAGRLARATTLLGGPRFALLAEAYAFAQPIEIRPEVSSIGIFMGGSDSADHSSVAIRACREHAGFDGHIEVAITSAHPRRMQLLDMARSSDLRVSVDLPDLLGFHSRHDLQIGAGGGATWERCCFGVPTLGIVVADNQAVTLPALAEQGAVELYRASCEVDPAALAAHLRPLLADESRRRALSLRARAVCDGQGARRVALKLEESALELRAATLADARLMFDWRNHETTRRVSSDASELVWDSHVAWLERTLGDASRHLYIAEVGGDPVGVIRFDLDGSREAEVSLYLDPALTGLGLGPTLLAEGEEALQRVSRVDAFRARVLEDNPRSRRLFERGGYRFNGSDGIKSVVARNAYQENRDAYR
jgi:UDP-2,4-diacetamido-2,4,6-trideoxy-beta-L-altropyranose hydrolase